jgi:hypothetical protein
VNRMVNRGVRIQVFHATPLTQPQSTRLPRLPVECADDPPTLASGSSQPAGGRGIRCSLDGEHSANPARHRLPGRGESARPGGWVTGTDCWNSWQFPIGGQSAATWQAIATDAPLPRDRRSASAGYLDRPAGDRRDRPRNGHRLRHHDRRRRRHPGTGICRQRPPDGCGRHVELVRRRRHHRAAGRYAHDHRPGHRRQRHRRQGRRQRQRQQLDPGNQLCDSSRGHDRGVRQPQPRSRPGRLGGRGQRELGRDAHRASRWELRRHMGTPDRPEGGGSGGR